MPIHAHLFIHLQEFSMHEGAAAHEYLHVYLEHRFLSKLFKSNTEPPVHNSLSIGYSNCKLTTRIEHTTAFKTSI